MSENKSDTPRTDEQIGHMTSTMTSVRIDFASQLERELNQAKENESVLRAMLQRVCNEAFNGDDTIGGELFDDYILRMIAGIKKERDEYAKQAEGYKALLISETQMCDEARECLKEAIECWGFQVSGWCTGPNFYKAVEQIKRWRKAAGLAE